ncbi:hypothetical protein [Kaistella polysaccharea]|uniref:hypothetical protein n=1 Tax=Kaistella polysaccharea TaxID=2878534 RepID=UPI001CF22CC7|nr:hypothetical protein [Kaistella polysaccharea]
MIRSTIFLILIFLLFSCKKKDETLDLKYEVLNQLIDEDIVNDKVFRDANSYLYKILKPSDIAFKVKVTNYDEPPPPASSSGTIYLPEDGIFSKEDLKHIKIQLKTNSNFVLDTARIISKVDFINEEKLYKIRENYKSADDYWMQFRREFGNKCIRSYSIPYFNKEKDICIVITSMSCGPLEGGGSTAIFKKINGKWKVIQTLDQWVS